jgi:hypothetical protein
MSTISGDRHLLVLSCLQHVCMCHTYMALYGRGRMSLLLI